jgi:hypothetical protein
MRTKFILLVAGAMGCFALSHGQALEFKEHISKNFTLQKGAAETTVAVYNITGPIQVQGYDGNQVIMEIGKTISADNAKDLETGKNEFKMEFVQTADTVMAYISEPFDSRPHRHWRNSDEDHDIDYNYRLEFTIKVPNGCNVHLSTINEGDIAVKQVYGTLSIHNVNGAISISDAKGATVAHTVNGGITANYLSNPPDASFNTINGEIRLVFSADLSADLQFKSMNGQFYTDFPNVEILPVSVVKTQEKKSGATMYKLNKHLQVRVGAGGKLFKFETLNGNIYIKKQS